MKVLVIQSSMTVGSEKGSISTKATNLFVEHYKLTNPNDEIIYLDLNKDEAGLTPLTSENFGTFFNISDKYINQLKDVSKVVVGSPMTNFNYTAVLKNYLDHVLVAKKTFAYKYDGKGLSDGLLKHLKVQIINSQGAPKGWYPWGDHTTSLVGTWEFMGAEVVKPIIIDGTKTSEKINLSVDEVVAPFREVIELAAKSF